MRALVVEQGYSRGALAAVRALAQAGWWVGVGTPDGRGLAAASRSCARRHRVPAAHADQPAFLAAVARAVAEGGYEVVFGAGEAEVLTLSEYRHAVPAVVPHAEHRSVLAALDKARLAEAAVAAGFAVPRTLEPGALTDEALPVVVKARLHARPGQAGAPPRIDTNVVVGATATRRRVGQIAALGGEAEVQEYLEGRLTAYAAVVGADGRVVAESMQEASRIWPPGAGASCRAVSVPVPPELAGRAAALLAALGWFGLAELQFLVPADGSPRLIDLNGRYYGSLALAVAAGANLPAVWAALATGRAAAPVTAAAGVRYSWWEGDLRRAVRERRGGLVRDLAGALGAGVGAVHSIGRWRDPAPALAQARRLLAERRNGRG
ncbi:ATP-grasp domain-containing protein [Jatrophihabitans sp.]|uniref:ATP-grasp domain-containing protein n=1 Tax=Jatrophihabitans sp. TaxID=1932789 RepID=UPI002C48FDC8|nr:ATP-grasp domain-containing protein [Jatrophihabitans sp.]